MIACLSHDRLMTNNDSRGGAGTWHPSRRVAVLAVAILCSLYGTESVHVEAADEVRSKAPGLETCPSGWSVIREIEVTSGQLATFSGRLQAPLTGLFNTFLKYDNRELQINTLVTTDAASARTLVQTLRRTKSNPRWIVQNGTRVYEFVVRQTDQARLACVARYVFPIQPAKMTYRVEFDAIPLLREYESARPDGRNRLFNLFLQVATKPELSQEIQKLAASFEAGREVELVRNLQRAVDIEWSSAEGSEPAESETIRVPVSGEQRIAGLPVIHLQGNLKLDHSVVRSADRDRLDASLLNASDRFPVEDDTVSGIVDAIVRPGDPDAVKLQKLLDWFGQPANMRYDGLTGSRYGVATVVRQKFGRCWDYSDLFVTFARRAGLPCRQVYGWMHESEGHVWCDVFVDGHWQMIDPTTGTLCGSDYLPFCISATGEFGLMYASAVAIEAR